MFSAKTVVVALIAAATGAVANPVSRQDDGGTCSFIMTPTPDLGATEDAHTDLNFAIGHTIGNTFLDKSIDFVNDPVIANGGGTYNITTEQIGVEGVPTTVVLALVESWAQTTIDGIAAEWFVNSVDCGGQLCQNKD
ncbi:hypothetical protein D9757_012470 [Collybiopsis confluens]|uniref:Uncharacterized protein n=1 Tax=Collybiopsis confluens TaxID=2823264 RepID=A0A8H5G185_9AGAR|nr:hypothetical protein D9757_012470 [Collybiopsis confluens]